MRGSVIVTGAGSGIGAVVARRLADDGWRVGVLDHSEPAARALAAELDGVALVASVSDEHGIADAFRTFGTLDAVVHNAGIVRFGPLLDLSLDDWTTVVEVNLTGAFVVGRQAARCMGRGAIVNIGSINGVVSGPNSGAYGPTKAGVHLLTQLMAAEWAPRIRVNAVAPGLIDAGMSTAMNADPATRAARASTVPLGRLGSAEDVAGAVAWLLHEDAAYVTGQTIVVDGGITHAMLANLPRPAAAEGS